MRKILNIFIITCLSLFTLSISGCSTPPTDKKYVKSIPIPDDVAPGKKTGKKKQDDYDFDDDEDDKNKEFTCEEKFSKCMDDCKDIEKSDDGSIDWEKPMCVNSCKIKYNFCNFLNFF
jgi:hypothetical protein